MLPLEPRTASSMGGHNGLEASIAISNVLSRFSSAKGRKFMQPDKVKEILRRLNAGGIHYALVGGLAYSLYAPPRATEDMDLLVLVEDTAKVRELFPGCYQRGTAVAGVYQYEGTRFDVQPAHLRMQVAAVENALGSSFEGEPARVVSL